MHAARDGRSYVLDTARVFPPEAPSTSLQGFLVHAQSLEAQPAAPAAPSPSDRTAPRERQVDPRQGLRSFESASTAGGSGKASVTVLDLDRSRAVAEILEVLATSVRHGAAAALSNRAAEVRVHRVDLPGSAIYIRADANPHLCPPPPAPPAPTPRLTAGRVVRPRAMPPGEHASHGAVYGVNPVASALLRSLSRLVGNRALAAPAASTAAAVASAVSTAAAAAAAGARGGDASADGALGTSWMVYGDAVIVSGERGQHLYNVLRCEQVLRSPRPLSSDAFTRFGMHGAADHNAEVLEATRTLLHRGMPVLARALATGALPIVSRRAIVDALHAAGLNVRHLGMLRVLLTASDSDGTSRRMQSADRTADMPVRLQRLRSTLLTELVTRVVKQLLREAMRTLAEQTAAAPAPASAGGASAAGSDGGDGEEDARMRLLRRCINRVLAPHGAWSLKLPAPSAAPGSSRGAGSKGASSGSDRESDSLVAWRHGLVGSDGGGSDDSGSTAGEMASAVIWGTVIRTHLQLKFGGQLPALDAAELEPGFDLRAGVPQFALGASLAEQLGVSLSPAAVMRLASAGSPVFVRSALVRDLQAAGLLARVLADASLTAGPGSAAGTSVASAAAITSASSASAPSQAVQARSVFDILSHPHDPFVLPQARTPQLSTQALWATGAMDVAPFGLVGKTHDGDGVGSPMLLPGEAREVPGHLRPAPADRDESLLTLRRAGPRVGGPLHVLHEMTANAPTTLQTGKPLRLHRGEMSIDAARLLIDALNGGATGGAPAAHQALAVAAAGGPVAAAAAAGEDDECYFTRVFGVHYGFTAAFAGIGELSGRETDTNVVKWARQRWALAAVGRRWHGMARLLRAELSGSSAAGAMGSGVAGGAWRALPAHPSLTRAFSEESHSGVGSDAPALAVAAAAAAGAGKDGAEPMAIDDSEAILPGEAQLSLVAKPLLQEEALVASIRSHPAVAGLRVSIARAQLLVDSAVPCSFDMLASTPNVGFTNAAAGVLAVLPPMPADADAEQGQHAPDGSKLEVQALQRLRVFPADTATLYASSGSAAVAVASVALMAQVERGTGSGARAGALGGTAASLTLSSASASATASDPLAPASSGADFSATTRAPPPSLPRGCTPLLPDMRAVLESIRTPELLAALAGRYSMTTPSDAARGFCEDAAALAASGPAAAADHAASLAPVAPNPHITALHFVVHPGNSTTSNLRVGLSFMPIRPSNDGDMRGSFWIGHTGSADGFIAMSHPERYRMSSVDAWRKRGFSQEDARRAASSKAVLWRSRDSLPDVITLVCDTASGSALAFINGRDAGVYLSGIPFGTQVETVDSSADGFVASALRPFVSSCGATGIARVTFVYECGAGRQLPHGGDLERQLRSVDIVSPTAGVLTVPPAGSAGAAAASAAAAPAVAESAAGGDTAVNSTSASASAAASAIPDPYCGMTVDAALGLIADGVTVRGGDILDMLTDDSVQDAEAVPRLFPEAFLPQALATAATAASTSAGAAASADAEPLPPVVVRRLNELYLLTEALGPAHRRVLTATVAVAEAAARSGLPRAAVDILLRAFTPSSAPGASASTSTSASASSMYPQHCLARAYVLLGDVCLLDTATADVRTRWMNAERWYARALTCLLVHAPTIGARASALMLLRASAGLESDAATDERWGSFKNLVAPDSARGGGGADWEARCDPTPHLHPYALTVVDRLIGVVRAQHRAAHARTLVRCFLQLHALFPCPIGILERHMPNVPQLATRVVMPQGVAVLTQRPFDAAHGTAVFAGTQLPLDDAFNPSVAGPGGAIVTNWTRNPWERVFGRPVPHALSAFTEIPAYNAAKTKDL